MTSESTILMTKCLYRVHDSLDRFGVDIEEALSKAALESGSDLTKKKLTKDELDSFLNVFQTHFEELLEERLAQAAKEYA